MPVAKFQRGERHCRVYRCHAGHVAPDRHLVSCCLAAGGGCFSHFIALSHYRFVDQRTFIFLGEHDTALYAAVMVGLSLFAHRENISRLRAGTEPKIGS